MVVTDFILKIWYASSDEDTPQVEVLTQRQVESALGAFTRDMDSLEGRGVRKLQVEVKS